MLQLSLATHDNSLGASVILWNFVKKANHLSSYVMGTLRNMENVVGNFVTCTAGRYGGFKM